MPPTAQDYLFMFRDRSDSSSSSNSCSLRPPSSPLSTLSTLSATSTAPSDTSVDDRRLRPFACSEPGCGRRFSRKFTLGEHTKTHTGERPYRCPLAACAKRFSTSGNLARHKRLHKDIKPFDCPVATCQRSFPTEDKLRHHVKIHTGDKVHACAVAGCHKTFSTAGNLTRHTKLHHPEVDPRLYLSPRIRPRRIRVASSSSPICIQAPVATPAPTGPASPSGVDAMDQRLDQLLIASPAPTPHAFNFNAWPTRPFAPPLATPPAVKLEPPLSPALKLLEPPMSPESSDDFDCDPLLDDHPAPGAGRYSLSLLDDVVKFELTEA